MACETHSRRHHSHPYDIFVIDNENYIKIKFLRFSNTWEIIPRIDLYTLSFSLVKVIETNVNFKEEFEKLKNAFEQR